MKLKLRKGEAWAEARLDSLGAANCGDVCGSPSAPDYSGIAAANEKSAELARQQAANQAGADIAKQFESQRAPAQPQLASIGVKPNAGSFMAANREADAAEAAARASAMTTNGQAVRDKGVSLRTGAAAFDQSQTNTAGQPVGLSTSSGSAATQSAGVGVGLPLAAGGQVAGGYGAQVGSQNLDVQANLSLGGLLNSSYQAQAHMSNAGMAGLGSLIGMGATLYANGGALTAASSNGVKEDKQPIDDEATIEAIKDLPRDAWTYKVNTGNGGRHICPYAEDVREHFAEASAPSGKMIDLMSMSSAQAATINGLTRKREAEYQEATIEELPTRLAQLTKGHGCSWKGAERHG